MSKENNKLSFSQKISDIRSHFGYSQDVLAEKLGVSGSAIGLLQQGKTKSPSAELLASLTRVLGISPDWLLNDIGPMLRVDADAQKTSPHIAPSDAHAVGFLNDMPSVELPHASFKTWASFNDLAGSDVRHPNEHTPTLLYRLPPGRTAEDYKDAIVFDIEGDSMEPNLRSGQQVIAWYVPESKWEHLHNTACIVSYGDTVTVKAIVENELFANNRLTLRATGGAGGSFAVSRSDIHSIWEVREFYGRVPFRLIAA